MKRITTVIRHGNMVLEVPNDFRRYGAWRETSLERMPDRILEALAGGFDEELEAAQYRFAILLEKAGQLERAAEKYERLARTSRYVTSQGVSTASLMLKAKRCRNRLAAREEVA